MAGEKCLIEHSLIVKKSKFYPHHSFEVNKKASIFMEAFLEAWAGIAPAYKGFADPCLTTWLPGHK